MATLASLLFNGGLTDTAGNSWSTGGSISYSTTDKVEGTSSLSLNGSSYIYSANATLLSAMSNSFTIHFWAYCKGVTGNYNYQGNIYSCGFPSSYNSSGFSIHYNYSTGKFRWTAAPSTNAYFLDVTGSSCTDKFHHIAFTYDKATKVVTSFFDGVKKESVTMTETLVSTNITRILVGVLSDGDSNPYRGYFNGNIDNLQVEPIVLWTSNFTPPTSGSWTSTTLAYSYII